VVADVGGRLAAPVYGMFQVQDLLANYTAPDGVKVEAYWFGPPPSDNVSSLEWTGEWTVTFETFRDMGAAFMVALILIYILVVWEFGNFRIPALIMAPIPLTLLGIIPMHAIMGAEFTATSMIGWIALAGIIVRNSILLVDFSIHEIQRGIPVAEAVIRSCNTRTRPIMITALALVCGSSVIFTDPIFQGMAISLASGVMVSTILTLIVIPLGCMKASRSLCEVAAAGCPVGTVLPSPEDMTLARPAKARASSKGPSLVLRIWSIVANVLLMAFYLIRGIFLLLMQWLKRPKKVQGGSTPPPSPPTTPPAPTNFGGTVPVASGTMPGSAAPATNSEAGAVARPQGDVSSDQGDSAFQQAERSSASIVSTGETTAKSSDEPGVSVAEDRPITIGPATTSEEKDAGRPGQSLSEGQSFLREEPTKSDEAIPPMDTGTSVVSSHSESEIRKETPQVGRRSGRRGIRLKVSTDDGQDRPDRDQI